MSTTKELTQYPRTIVPQLARPWRRKDGSAGRIERQPGRSQRGGVEPEPGFSARLVERLAHHRPLPQCKRKQAGMGRALQAGEDTPASGGRLARRAGAPARRKHWLFAVDGTPYSRPHARCLEDRSIVHQSSPVSRRAPITIGHQYSLAVALPEKARSDEPAWVLPLSSRRVPSDKTPNRVGQEQVWALLDDPQLPSYELLATTRAASDC